MKVILSRKGFDGTNGGMPSPIMPNGDAMSMPIPSDDRVSYRELKYGKMTYWSILKDLKPSFHEARCHLDPDLDSRRLVCRPKGWKPAFGQIGTSSSYLINTVGLKPGDLFLFFGNFRFVEEQEGKLRFTRRTGDFYHDKPIQLIWGYLQVGEIITDGNRIRREYDWHPHARADRTREPSNMLVVPTEELSFAKSRPGCGLLPFSEDRVLTKPGATKATWRYNRVYSPESIIGNRKSMSSDGIFYSGIWQELGLKESAEATNWACHVVLCGEHGRC